MHVLVVTGGHSHDVSVYSLFDGDDAFAATDSHPVALRDDLRNRFHVLALHDFVPDVAGEERPRLKEFVLSGKGLLVLHHAMSDYQSWTWWSREAVGGRYFMKPEGDRPASTTRGGQEYDGGPLRHPITSGVARIRFHDEALAWVSPCRLSRVVVILPGHDRKRHCDPAYRTLVKNALLWTAGRVS